MTNSPATFQAIMNEILRDLINKEKVVAFVDNVLVGIETEEGHNEIVEEILRRLEENDLYIKLEKCMWKVRKIGFLGVIIGPNKIEMECQVWGRTRTEWARVEWNYSGIEGIDNKMGNNLGLSSCAVSRSAVACIVAYFRRTELLSGASERSGID